jgi:LCP family protein required for cell wall assembly
MTGPFDEPPRADDDGSGSFLPPKRALPPELDPRGSGKASRSGNAPRTPKPPSPPKAAGAGLGAGQRRNWGPRRIRSWTRRRLISTVAGSLVLVLVLIAGAAAYEGYSILNGVHTKPCPSCESAIGGKGLNILIIGSDSRAGLTAAQIRNLHVGSAANDPGQRSDTMILLHIPADGGKADMVSLPRDSYVTIPAHKSGTTEVPAQQNKLNAAYSFGGADLAVRTVEFNTHVRINHYIEINFEGFVNMVKALGGVTICSKTAINDPVVKDASGGYSGSGLVLPVGKSKLDGAQALEYVRAREFDPSQGDLGRVKRQQQFMAAMLGKARSAGVLLNLLKLRRFLKSVAGSLTTDKGLGKGQILSLAERLHSMSPSNVSLLTVPLSNTNYASPNAGSAVLWDQVLSQRLFHDFSADKPITNVTRPQHLTVPPSDISVKVLNATPTNGKAATVSAALTGIGFISGGTDDAPSGANPATTVVLYGPTRGDSAKTVVAAVPGASKRQVASLGTSIELVVGTNYSGVKAVKVSTSTDRPTITTGASNPCS